MKIVVIELGTNSIKYLEAETINNEIIISFETAITTRLGENVNLTGRYSEEAMIRTLKAVKDLYEKSLQFKYDKLIIAGTQSLRVSDNALVFAERLRKICPQPIRILTSEDEAKLSFLGVANSHITTGNTLIFDSGGGSTELIIASENDLKLSCSIDIGAVSLTDKFQLSEVLTAGKKKEVFSFLTGLFNERINEDQSVMSLMKNRNFDEVIGVGGTANTLLSIKKSYTECISSKIINEIYNKEIMAFIEEVSKQSLHARRAIPGLSNDRADIILGGAIIIAHILDKFAADKFYVSEKGVRHGLLFEAVSNESLIDY
ncbi:MAG: hypothetical protein PHR06_00415 [Candidatus Cloacimonetes bacterium]|nr:hypothetical protein [Candidatus Cloacimonadota bacterium]